MRLRAQRLGWIAAIVALAMIAAGIAVRALSRRETPSVAPSPTIPAGEASAAAASASAPEPGLTADPTAAPGPSSQPGSPAIPEPPPPARCPPEPKLEVRSAELPPTSELMRLAREDPRSLGSASIGTPTRGSLWGGVEMKESEGIVRAGAYGWGTEMVVRSIERAVREVRRCHPGSPNLHVGDIARERGGWLRPHRSHQSGLDADLGYYYRNGAIWYQHATAENLDVARTWTLVRSLIEGGNVEMIFMDFSVQRILKAHLETLPESERPPADLFENPTRKDAIIRHTWGHATHFHVRFTDPAAVKLGQRLGSELLRLPKPPRPKAVPPRPKAAPPRPKAIPPRPKALPPRPKAAR